MDPYTCSSIPSYFRGMFAKIASAGHPKDLPIDMDRPSVFSPDPVQPEVIDMSSIEGFNPGITLD